MASILLVEDEKLIRWGFRRALEARGHVVDEAASLEQAENHLRDHRPDILILDVRLPDGNGVDFMVDQKAALSESLVIVITASGAIDTAVRAMKAGAVDFLSKPLSEEEMLAAVDQATERLSERNAVERTRREGERAIERTVVARSVGMKSVLEMAGIVAASPAATVLVTGETGTGKEVIARFVHAQVGPEQPSDPGAQLRRAPGEPRRERAVRAREGRLHGCQERPQGDLRARGRRDHRPGRGR